MRLQDEQTRSQEKRVIGVSQAWHLDSDFSLEIAHTEQTHWSVLTEGIFMPAAAKSKPLTGTAGGLDATAGGVNGGAAGAESPCGVGASHAAHFEADNGFVTMQSEHVHVSFLGVGTFIPAAAKSNPFNGGADVEPKELDSKEVPEGKGLGILGGLRPFALNLGGS